MLKKLSLPIILSVTVALVAVVTLTWFFLVPWMRARSDREMTMVGTGRTFDFDFDSGAAFHSNDSRFFYFSTREGMRQIASNANLIWHEAHSFNNPRLATAGDIVAVGEVGGAIIHVFGSDGQMFSVNMDNPVVFFDVTDTGFLSVIARYDGGYGMYVLNQTRPLAEDPLFHWDFYEDLIVPTRIVVSPDGTYVAISFLCLNINVRSFVQFRYLNQWDAWGTDFGLFATQDFPDEYITGLRFMNDNKLLIATTAQIACFQLGPLHTSSRKVWGIEPENAKAHIAFYNGTHFAFTAGERKLTAEGEGYPVGTVFIYNAMNGNRTGVFELGRRATHLRMGHDAVIVGGDRSFHAMDFRGNPLWEHTSMFETRDVLFLDNINTILVAGSNHAEIFERRRLREDDFNEGVVFQ
ncbi:MAG: DUF5711 family protein [Defluviitaleaceae bacterium]|nr:DUF5711 family protein [Defluviitaleaceae bacterium]